VTTLIDGVADMAKAEHPLAGGNDVCLNASARPELADQCCHLTSP
jgi:hypothetical protein